MNTKCMCGCRRPAKGEWLHPTHGTLTLAALCNMRHAPALEAQCWAYFPELNEHDDEAPRLTLTGGMDAPLD